MNLSKLEIYGPHVGLYVGLQGSGKSSAIASWAKKGKMKIFDIDKRARGILGSASFLGQEVINNIEIVQYDYSSLNDVWKAVAEDIEMDLVKAKSNRLEYKTGVLESATTLADIMTINSQRLRGLKSESVPGGSKIRGKHIFCSPDDYNYTSSVFRTLFYEYLLAMKCNFIVSGWIVEEYGPNPEGPYLPDIKIGESLNTTRKLSQRIPGFFDEIYLFKKEETPVSGKIRYFVQFESQMAKTATPALKGLGKTEITNRCFVDVMESYLTKEKKDAN